MNVVVTGAGTGIGAAVTAALRARGEQVLACGRRPRPLQDVAGRTGALPLAVDVATPAGADAVVATAVEAFGTLDGLVLNAGIVRAGTVDTLSVQDWEETLRTNLTAPFLLVRAALEHLVRSGGSVVTVGSVAGLRASPAYAAYGASKAGLHMLTQNLAVDLGPRGVRVNCVAPGWVRTEMGDAEMAEFGEPLGLDLDESYARVTAAVPQRRAATPAEVASVITWLLTPAASYVHGAVVPVDGGTSVVDAGSLAFLPAG
ncbi:SDR family NAD(P)-dependent oxidoreductase [Kineococcus auxinigenes]|uniref:SDR family NAD(P)-dependent oxidoreductase n=1 Tax=unclassified Kineococcus TaxID=2621656 RepID=UPI003D7DC655